MRSLASVLVIVVVMLSMTRPVAAQQQTEAPVTEIAAPAAEAPSADVDEMVVDPRIVFGAIATGVGLAGVVAGAVIGGIAAKKFADLDCPDDQCSAEQWDEAEEYNDLRVPAGVTVTAGVLVTFVGGAFLAVGLAECENRSVSFELGPGSLGVAGTF